MHSQPPLVARRSTRSAIRHNGCSTAIAPLGQSSRAHVPIERSNTVAIGKPCCGENGEFHAFVSAGPMFSAPIAVAVGETVERDGFVFADVVPA
jgi:hypothetical protein